MAEPTTPRRGGSRPGAGPKPKGRIKRDISLPPVVWQYVEDFRVRRGIKTTGEAVEELLTGGLMLAFKADKLPLP